MKINLTAIAFSLIFILGLARNSSAELLYSNDISYLGSFSVPNMGSSPQTTHYGGTAIGYNPDGNGGLGSLFINGFANAGTYIGELSIPAALYTGNDVSTVSQAPYIASMLGSSPYFWDISNSHYSFVGAGGVSVGCENGWGVGGLWVDSPANRLYATSYCYYGMAHNALPIITHGTNLAGSTYAGNYGLNLGSTYNWFEGQTGDLNSGAIAAIPAEYQSQLGGKILIGANPHNMSIVTRTSFGPALTAVNPDLFTTANTQVPGYSLSCYPAGHMTLGVWGELANDYISQADAQSAIAFPAGSQSVLVVGKHGVGGPGTVCPGMATSGIGCYGMSTDLCSEVCLNNPPAGSGIPQCTGAFTSCGGLGRGTENCCYNPPGAHQGGHSNTAWPYRTYIWAYDVGDAQGSNTAGNNVQSMSAVHPQRNNLTAVKLGYLNPWDLYPYATWQLSADPFNEAANLGSSGYISGGTYDPESGKLYTTLYQGVRSQRTSIIEVWQVSQGVSSDTTAPVAPAGLVVR